MNELIEIALAVGATVVIVAQQIQIRRQAKLLGKASQLVQGIMQEASRLFVAFAEAAPEHPIVLQIKSQAKQLEAS